MRESKRNIKEGREALESLEKSHSHKDYWVRGQGTLNDLKKWHANLLKITGRIMMDGQPIMHPHAFKNIMTNNDGLPTYDALN